MFSTPTVVGDLVFVAACNGVAQALDRGTGERRWTLDARQDSDGINFHGDPLVTENLIVLGSDGPRVDSAAYVYALERATGKVRWKYRADRGVATDIVRDGERLYAVSLTDHLICLDLESGRLLWTFASASSNEKHILARWTPAVSEGRVFFGGLDGLVYALDARSGREVWRRDLGSPIWTPILLLPSGLYVGTFDGRVHRLSGASGAALGGLDVGGLPFGPLTAAGDSLLLLVATDDRGATLKALDPSLAQVRWSRDPSAGKWTSGRPYVWKESVLAGSGQGELASISPTDGSVRWSSTLQGTIRGIGADVETLYVGTLEGTLYAYAPAEVGDASQR